MDLNTSATSEDGGTMGETDILERLCLEYAQMMLRPPRTSGKASDNAVDEAIETIFPDLDAVTALADSARLDADHLTGTVLPALVAHGEALRDVFATIDKIEAFVNRAYTSAQVFARHVDALQGVYDAKNPKAMTRMMSLFSKKAAPVEMPEFDPEPHLFNATEVFDAMRQEAGLGAAEPAPLPTPIATPAETGEAAPAEEEEDEVVVVSPPQTEEGKASGAVAVAVAQGEEEEED